MQSYHLVDVKVVVKHVLYRRPAKAKGRSCQRNRHCHQHTQGGSHGPPAPDTRVIEGKRKGREAIGRNRRLAEWLVVPAERDQELQDPHKWYAHWEVQVASKVQTLIIYDGMEPLLNDEYELSQENGAG